MSYIKMTKETKIVAKSYLTGLSGSTMLAALAYVLALLINNYYRFDKTWLDLIQGIGFISAATAIYGFKDIPTWDARAQHERWNQNLYKIFSSCGFFLAILALFINK